MKKIESFLKFSPEVLDAIRSKRPLVALETTLVSHGLPYPDNIKLAKTLEEIIRKGGAIPVMIALLDGFIKIGLTEEELFSIGDEKNKSEVLKVSRKDIPYVIAMKKKGATTVSATMVAAAWAGIRLFATGGIGGVHREAHQTFDISADLPELARTSVAVVCSGAKSILDIGKTLELLETLGVPVVGYRTRYFPSFYSRESDYPLEYCLSDAESIAKFLQTKWDLDLCGGVVIANPIPKEDALESSQIEQFIEKALLNAQDKKVIGKAITPYLLKELFQISKGKTLQANLALLKENARLAAEIAIKYSEVQSDG